MSDFPWFAELQRTLPELKLMHSVPYSEVSSLGAGGFIPVLAKPSSDVELGALLKFAHHAGIAISVLGGGTNLVGADHAEEGIVIQIAQDDFLKISAGRRHLTAGAGIRMAELARTAANKGFHGFAALAGIPGTLGGALRMNAGANGHTIGEFVRQLCGLHRDGEIWCAEHDELQWDYRRCNLPPDVILTAAILEPPMDGNGNEKELQAIREELSRRRTQEPVGRTAGCMFRNVSDLDPAGKLIDEAHLKNFAVGNAIVSSKHANYILNRGSAPEHDVAELMKIIRTKVAEQTGFYLKSEAVFANPETLAEIESTPLAPRVLVLMGGVSSERDISLKSAAAVAQALRNAGYRVETMDITECRLTEEMKQFDVIYPMLHGGFGENGELQKLLEEAHLAFVGCPAKACDLLMDKIATKRLAESEGIPTAPWAVVTAADLAAPPAKLHLPLVLKAPREGSTVGIETVRKQEDWTAALERELQFAPEILAEEFVEGIEISVPVLDGRALRAIEIRSPNGFYDYDAKYIYTHGHTQYFCPPQTLPEAMENRAREFSEQFFRAVGGRDVLRMDFIVDKNGTPVLLEGNAIPGMTATSLVPKAARVDGISFERMTATLVHRALERSRQA